MMTLIIIKMTRMKMDMRLKKRARKRLRTRARTVTAYYWDDKGIRR
jgi:hypothetical protein